MDAILTLQNKGKDLILKGQKIPIEGNSQIREGQEKIIKGHELLNKGQDALEEVKELIETLMSFGVLTTVRISSKESSHMNWVSHKPSIGSTRNPTSLDQNEEDGEDHDNLRLGQPELYKQADKDDPKALLDGVDVAGLVGILRQLGNLAEYVSHVLI
ncbi:hypothetical protein SLEP1_g28785 [Rubroshorea leprosula]|uniref:Uncharacterized protein n=1 Tax=Rubroshorea leprosula TaxID=152421 RepID=A0AAV5K5X3_9ROSI|nr:hypothetical protein SLEP1_g28785 [Rubroshorea leprosula]